MLECIDELVGIVPAECGCLVDVPEGMDVTTSESGKYLSELMPVDFQKQCGHATVWNTLAMIRTSAKADLVQEVQMQLRKTHTIKSPWTGYIGSEDGSAVSAPSAWNGVKLSLKKQARGMYATIRSLKVRCRTAGTYSIVVVDRYGNAIEAPQSITIEAGDLTAWKSKDLTTEIRLPMWTDDSVEVQYRILWNAVDVLSNDEGCGSCTKPAWYAYFDASGSKASDYADPDTFDSSTHLSGLRPNVTLECDFSELMCDAQGDVRIGLAVLFQHLWAIRSIEYIINSGQINTYTAMGPEYLNGLLQNHTIRYNVNLEWFAAVLYTGDCATCNNRVQRKWIPA
ncbi:MAG: hypothetical protein JNM00_09525 [Flavobacteriales bacterium]|nr:hypothetical protein [Flavobacteriales bacterium]